MVAHFEFLLDQLAHSLQRPAIGWKATPQCAAIQHPFQLCFLHLAQLGLIARCFLSSETSYAFCFYDLSPITDGCSANTQVSSDLSLGQLAFLQKTTAFQASLFHLLATQIGGFP